MKRGRNDQSVLFGGIAPHFDPDRLKEAWLQIDGPIEIIERRMPIGAELAVLWAPFHARRWRPISASGAPWRPSEAKQAAACEIARILGEMSKFMPLDIRPRAGVIEGLELRIGGGAITLVEPRNTVGQREVCAFTNIDARGAAGGWPHLEGWCAGRVRAAQVGAMPDDSWSAGVLRRVLRPYRSRGVQCLVEPGVVRLVELVEAVTGATAFSCEGHPDGTYMALLPSDRVEDALRLAGFKVEPHAFPGSSLVFAHAPEFTDFDSRDAFLRGACQVVEAALVEDADFLEEAALSDLVAPRPAAESKAERRPAPGGVLSIARRAQRG